MATFYVTYGQDNPKRNNFSVIEAVSRQAAQRQVEAITAGKYSMIYTAGQFKQNKLTEVPLS